MFGRLLPYASGLMTSKSNPTDLSNAWIAAAAAEGVTSSERILAKLARRAFLSLWSYPNVYTDEGRKNGKGAGKELCDLFVVFGNDVLLFSDKDCSFGSHTDVKLAWRRWYTKAIAKSAKQLEGAEKFLREHPTRIYLDRLCEVKFPVALPPADLARYHLIAVTRGSHKAAERYFGGNSSGSYVILNQLVGEDHYKFPFHIGFPLANRRFVHVLDEFAIDVLLDELDTVADLVEYLKAKEILVKQKGIVTISGEEDLLARYMLNSVNGSRHFDIPRSNGGQLTMLQEGDWFNYRNSPEQIGRRFANQDSYQWDALIERHSGHIRSGTVVRGKEVLGDDESDDESGEQELVVRSMASEPRLARRMLVKQLAELVSKTAIPGEAHMRFVTLPKSRRGYVFLTLRQKVGQTYEDYRRQRATHARAYALGFRSRTKGLTEVLCIATEPLGDTRTWDLLYVSLDGELSQEARAWIDEEARRRGILRPEMKARISRGPMSDFPFHFEINRAPDIEVGAAARERNTRISRRKGKKQSKNR